MLLSADAVVNSEGGSIVARLPSVLREIVPKLSGTCDTVVLLIDDELPNDECGLANFLSRNEAKD